MALTDGPPTAADRSSTARPGVPPAGAGLCVLASGSGGNASVLRWPERGGHRSVLIDAGLSPRRARRTLEEVGVRPDEVSDIVLTHLDADHWHAGWAGGLGEHVAVRVHESHVARALRAGVPAERIVPFRSRVALGAGAEAACVLLAHDDAGVAAFRFEIGGWTLGFATDLGRVPAALTDLLSGVDVLAIESNYCPALQQASDRPEFLKRRIMDGRGHLSNAEAHEATDLIGPREHAVFLHLSRQCNRPELVAQLHAGADYAYTISSQHSPTRWVSGGGWLGRARVGPRLGVRV